VNFSPRPLGIRARVNFQDAIAEALEPRMFLSAAMMEGYSELSSRVALGDVNGDGKADLITLTPNKGKNKGTTFSVDVQAGKGDGTFGKAVSVATVTGEPVGIAAGDINHDGNLDLTLLQCDEIGASETILLGTGKGTFAKPLASRDVPQVEMLEKMSLADVNGDGNLDLALLQCNEDNLTVFTQLGKGDGTFTKATSFTYQMGSPDLEIDGVGLADFNGDKKADLAVLQCNGVVATLVTLGGNGDGTFQKPVPAAQVPASQEPRLAVGDFNGDGRSDAFVLGNLSPTGSVTHYLIGLLLPGDGQGTFGKPITTTIAGVVQGDLSLFSADVNGDGMLDLVLAGTHGPNVYTKSFMGDGSGNFE
jgi:hypothetical protein